MTKMVAKQPTPWMIMMDTTHRRMITRSTIFGPYLVETRPVGLIHLNHRYIFVCLSLSIFTIVFNEKVFCLIFIRKKDLHSLLFFFSFPVYLTQIYLKNHLKLKHFIYFCFYFFYLFSLFLSVLF